MARLSAMNKTLITVFCIYWFVIFPIIWFVIRPPSIVNHIGQAMLFALYMVIVYLMLHCTIMCLFKKFKAESSAQPRRAPCEKTVSANPNWTPAEEHLYSKVPYQPQTNVVNEKETKAPPKKPRPMSSFRNPYEGTATSRMLRAMHGNPKYERNITRKFIVEERNHTNCLMTPRDKPKPRPTPTPRTMEDCCRKDKSDKYVSSIKLFYDGNKQFQVDQ